MPSHRRHKTVISVVVPTFKREALLLECVKSILSGTYKQFEVIVVDQDPAKLAREKLRRTFPREPRLRYYMLKNAGLSKAKNFGLRRATGKYVAWIDDDAVADPQWLAAYVRTFDARRPKPALIAGRIDPIWPGRRPAWYPQGCEYILGLYNIGSKTRLLPENDLPIGANMAGVRDIVLRLGGFSEQLGYNYFDKTAQISGEDSLLGVNVRAAGYRILYEPRARVRHRIPARKLGRRSFLRRFYWEGVSIILRMHRTGTLGPRRAQFRWHSANAARMCILSLWPNLSKGRDPSLSMDAARMTNLSRLAYSLGVLYAVVNLRRLRREP